MRVSSLPRFLSCPSSELEVERPYDPASSAADLGTAVHECMAAHVVGDEPEVDDIAKRFGVDPDEVQRLYAYGRIAWREMRQRMPDAEPEVSVHGIGLHGHIDVLSDVTETWVLDWKSNWVERDYRDQLTGYAKCVTDERGWPEPAEVHCAVVWLRKLEVEIFTVTPDDVHALEARILDAERNVDKRYGPGEACTFCRRQLVCEARAEYLRSAADALVPLEQSVPSQDFLPALWERSRALRNALNRYESAVKLALADGPMTTPDGTHLELIESHRDRLLPLEAIEVLTSEGLGPSELAEVLSVSKTRALDVVARNAGRGYKGKRKAAVIKRLQDAGAVHQVSFQTIKATRSKS